MNLSELKSIVDGDLSVEIDKLIDGGAKIARIYRLVPKSNVFSRDINEVQIIGKRVDGTDAVLGTLYFSLNDDKTIDLNSISAVLFDVESINSGESPKAISAPSPVDNNNLPGSLVESLLTGLDLLTGIYASYQESLAGGSGSMEFDVTGDSGFDLTGGRKIAVFSGNSQTKPSSNNLSASNLNSVSAGVDIKNWHKKPVSPMSNYENWITMAPDWFRYMIHYKLIGDEMKESVKTAVLKISSKFGGDIKKAWDALENDLIKRGRLVPDCHHSLAVEPNGDECDRKTCSLRKLLVGGGCSHQVIKLK
jgi:hypothetical protein